MDNQNRWKSPVLWSALAAQVITILVLTGIINTGLDTALNGLVGSLLEVLVAFGVMNNPTNGKGF